VQRFAKELVALQPDLILSHVTPTTVALLQQTRTIPIIFVWVSDPVGSGFVASLARPGGNATGFTPLVGSLGGKWVELLKEIAPHVVRAVALFNPTMAPYAEYYLNKGNKLAKGSNACDISQIYQRAKCRVAKCRVSRRPAPQTICRRALRECRAPRGPPQWAAVT
jgi:hypothetical protein